MNPFDFFMLEPTVILNSSALQRALARIAHEIAERNESSAEVVLVGIQRGGVHLAARLTGFLAGIWGHAVPVGSVDDVESGHGFHPCFRNRMEFTSETLCSCATR